MYLVTPFLNQTRGDRFEQWQPTSEMTMSIYRYNVEAVSVEDAAEMAFALAGNDPQYFDRSNPRTERSLSVGDLVVVDDLRNDLRTIEVLAVASVGFVKVTDEVAVRVINQATMTPEGFAAWSAEADAARIRARARRAALVARIGRERVEPSALSQYIDRLPSAASAASDWHNVERLSNADLASDE